MYVPILYTTWSYTMEQVMRKCTKCGEEKELALFERRVKNGFVSHRNTCKTCRNAQKLELFKSNPDKLEARNKRQQELLKSNPERLAKKQAKDRERQKKLKVEAPERLKAINDKRRASEGHKQWEKEYAKKQAVIRVSERVGEVCIVEYVDCALCKCMAIVRPDNVVRKNGRRFCDKCNTKNVRVLGLKLERSIVSKNCIVCEKQYNGRAGGDKRCDECERVYVRQERRKRRIKDRANGKVQPSSLRSRARKAGVYMETVIPKKVYDRDKWRCVSCKCKVIYSFTYHPRQASIDHIIPLSMGGSHTYGNVQTMCVTCNSSKSNSIVSNVQLTMFDAVRIDTP